MTDPNDNEQVSLQPGWKNSPKLADLMQNYNDALIEQKKQISRVQTWRDNYNITGSAKMKKIPGRSNMQPRIIRKQAEWRYPTLTEPFLSTEDIFNIYPTSAAEVKRAQQNQLVLNYQFNKKIKKVKFIDEYVRTGVDEGTIVVRVGWQSREREVTREVPAYQFIPTNSPDLQRRYMTLLQLSKTDPETFKQYADEGVQESIKILLTTGQLVVAQQIGIEKITETELVENCPTLEVCDIDNIIIDPSCNGDFSKAQFIIYNFETSKSELKKSGVAYKNLEHIGTALAPSPLSTPDYAPGVDNTTFTFKDDARSKFVATEYWGFWDINDTGIAEPFVATWVGNTLIRLEKSPFPDQKLPFVIVSHMPVKRSIYGEPDGELLADNQKVIGAVMRGMIDLLGRSAAGQTGTRKDFLDATNTRKFREGSDYQFNANVDPRIGVYQHTYPEIPASAYNMLNMQNAEAESLSGVKTYSENGISGNALGNVAAGIRGVLDATSKRDMSILRRLSEGIIEIGHKIISMNAEFLSEEEIIPITDEEFIPVKRDDLGGEHDIRLVISTAAEDNAKAQELAFMLQTGAAAADPGEVRIIRAEIARLRKMPALAKRIESYEPQPDPIAMEKAKKELLLLDA